MPFCHRGLATALMNEFEAQLEGGERGSPPQWKGAPAIKLAHQLNEQCIELLCNLAAEQYDQAPWPFLEVNRDLWCRLDSEARRRLATFPFVIVDIHFGVQAWWLEPRHLNPVYQSGSATHPAMPPTPWECLALEALMFAWQVAKDDRRVAHMVFGMAPAVTSIIASLSMQQVRVVASHSAQVMRVRWDDKPKFWRELLIAARATDASGFMALKHHAARRLLHALALVSRPGASSGHVHNQ
jgi:hypothetical protein